MAKPKYLQNHKLDHIKVQGKQNNRGSMSSSKNDLSFTGHSDGVVKSSMIISGLLLRTFKTRKALPLMKTFNSYIERK